jgi:hypothetical protein
MEISMVGYNNAFDPESDFGLVPTDDHHVLRVGLRPERTASDKAGKQALVIDLFETPRPGWSVVDGLGAVTLRDTATVWLGTGIEAFTTELIVRVESGNKPRIVAIVGDNPVTEFALRKGSHHEISSVRRGFYGSYVEGDEIELWWFEPRFGASP